MTGWRSLPLGRRDQILIIVSLALLAALAWSYLIRLAALAPEGGGMALTARAWTPADFIMMVLMWAIMMIAMMVPPAMRAVLIYSGIVRKARASGKAMAPASLFISGYIAIWSLFSIAATGLQWQLESLSLLSPMMVTTSPALGAALLIGAGLYQLTPLKETCLKHCQSPAQFIANHYKKGAFGAFRLGLAHGAHCLGCCWVLMGLLFLGGVMNLIWILAISLFVLFEKLLPARLRTTRVTAMAMITGGLVFLLT